MSRRTRNDLFQKARYDRKWIPKGNSRLCPRDKAHALDVGETAVAVGCHIEKKWVPKDTSSSCFQGKAPALGVGETAVANDGPGAAPAIGETAVAVDGPGAASSSGEAAGAADGGEAAPAVLEAADAVNIHYAHERPSDLEDMWPHAPLHCPLDDPQSDHGCDTNVNTFPPGDSVVSEESQEESEGQEDAASAITERVRSKRRPKDITPAQQKLKSTWEGRNDTDLSLIHI